MENPGEELVGSYLRAILECSFVEYNLSTHFTQGEIDVLVRYLANSSYRRRRHRYELYSNGYI
jgi:hypothetical protein